MSVRAYPDADLARIIRRGVRPDGRTVVVMPSEMFSALTDADLGKILAYLHSEPPRAGPGRKVRVGPLARELGLMSRVARSRFSHFTDGEIGALRTYLVARAARRW